jgi:hypothetical protein
VFPEAQYWFRKQAQRALGDIQHSREAAVEFIACVMKWTGSNRAQNSLSSRLLFKKIKIYRAIILPFVMYECETWSLALREENKLRVFENRMLRRIFGPRREEMGGGWRPLHNEELHNL